MEDLIEQIVCFQGIDAQIVMRLLFLKVSCLVTFDRGQ